MSIYPTSSVDSALAIQFFSDQEELGSEYGDLFSSQEDEYSFASDAESSPLLSHRRLNSTGPKSDAVDSFSSSVNSLQSGQPEPPISSSPPTEQRLPRRIFAAYILGDIGNAATAGFFGYFLNIFLLDVALLPASVVTLFIFFSSLWDAFTDILFGTLSDKTISDFGRRRPFLLLGGICFAGFFYAFFQSPFTPESSSDHLFFRESYYFIVYLLYKASSTLFLLPYFALLPEITQSYDERTKLIAVKSFVSAIAITALIPLYPIIIQGFPQPLNPSQPDLPLGYSMCALMIFPLALIPGIFLFAIVKEPLLPPKPKVRPSCRDVSMAMLTNRGFIIVVAAMFFCGIATNLVGSNTVLWVTYVLQRSSDLSIVLLVLQVVGLLSMFFWAWLSSKIGKHFTLIVSILFYGIPCLAYYFLDSSSDLWLILLLMSLAGAGGSGIAILPMAMMVECIDADELKSGLRREGLYFGIYIFLGKFLMAFVLTCSNAIIAVAGYVNPVPGEGSPSQPHSVQTALRLIMVAGGLSALCGMIPSFFFPLTKAKHLEILKELRERHLLMNEKNARTFAEARMRATTAHDQGNDF